MNSGYKRGETNLHVDWFRDFMDKYEISQRMLQEEIFPHVCAKTLQRYWLRKSTARGIYIDALRYYSHIHEKGWNI